MIAPPSLNFNKALRPAFKQLLGKHWLVGAEIGVYAGNNAYNYLRELDINLVYLIDPYVCHKDYAVRHHTEKMLKVKEQQAKMLLEEYSHKITWIKQKSADAVSMFEDESLDFVYIDGNHIAKFALEDMVLYYPKVKKGGLLCGHDYRPQKTDRVADALHKFCKDTGLNFETLPFDWWIVK